jgi:hypothetical protein
MGSIKPTVPEILEPTAGVPEKESPKRRKRMTEIEHREQNPESPATTLSFPEEGQNKRDYTNQRRVMSFLGRSDYQKILVNASPDNPLCQTLTRLPIYKSATAAYIFPLLRQWPDYEEIAASIVLLAVYDPKKAYRLASYLDYDEKYFEDHDGSAFVLGAVLGVFQALTALYREEIGSANSYPESYGALQSQLTKMLMVVNTSTYKASNVLPRSSADRKASLPYYTAEFIDRSVDKKYLTLLDKALKNYAESGQLWTYLLASLKTAKSLSPFGDLVAEKLAYKLLGLESTGLDKLNLIAAAAEA